MFKLTTCVDEFIINHDNNKERKRRILSRWFSIKSLKKKNIVFLSTITFEKCTLNDANAYVNANPKDLTSSVLLSDNEKQTEIGFKKNTRLKKNTINSNGKFYFNMLFKFEFFLAAKYE